MRYPILILIAIFALNTSANSLRNYEEDYSYVLGEILELNKQILQLQRHILDNREAICAVHPDHPHFDCTVFN